MDSTDWWQTFLKHLKTAKKQDLGSDTLQVNLNSTLRLFHLFHENKKQLEQFGEPELKALLKKAETTARELQHLELETGNPSKRAFYASFSKTIFAGLETIGSSIGFAVTKQSKQTTKSALPSSYVAKPIKATAQGQKLTELKRRYTELMEANHRKSKNSQDSTPDEADRLHSFITVSAYWLQRLHALEYALNTLKENLALTEYPIDKSPLPLQFRMEEFTSSLVFRLVKASPRKPYPEDISILDVINDCYSIPVYSKDGNKVIEDTEVIRFLRLHSAENHLGVFKSDNLSQIGKQMYGILVEVIVDIKKTLNGVIAAINKTPLTDLEYAFYDFNPEECRTLLRRKFQSMLPGINERHYRKETGTEDKEKSTRTIETMEDYAREFEREKTELLTTPKSVMATAYWLRRMLISVIRASFAQEKKDHESQAKTPAIQSHSQQTNGRYLTVGTSITIGEDDIANFNINPDDIKSSEMSIQRADKADKWIAVRKSEKTHKILKSDFFGIVKRFIENDLNPALEQFNLNIVDLNDQLLPEIHERLADEQRIELIRSAILGTIITNLDEFKESESFHSTLRRYFRKPNYNNLHYPDSEKLALVSKGLVHSTTSILQMKFRRVLKVKEEITSRLEELKTVISEEALSRSQAESFQEEYKTTKALMGILNKIQQIMIYARPSLKDVKLEPDTDIVVFKSSASE